LATDSISAAATETTPGNALADGTHAWQIYAIDGSGAVRKSRQTWNIGIDTTPPQAFSLLSPADQSATGIPTPTLCWNAATDSGSGVDHYQLLVDGTMVRDNITSTCSTPTSTLAEGTHTWSVKAIDKMSNSRDSTQTWTIYADFGPPAGFSLLAPANGSTVDTLTPTFTWGAASDAGGLSHYELHIDSTCVACSIAATSTTFTLTTPLTAASHSWSVTAVDHAANSTVATGAPWTFTAGECAPDSAVACAGNSTGACNPGTHTCSASGTWGTCTGVVTPVAENCGNGIDDDCDGLVDCADPDCAAACGIVSEPGPEAGAEPRPELGPEPTTEPPRDAGVDVASDSAQDSPATTATATNTATTTPTGTSTATTTVTGSNTGTATVTGIATSTGPTGTGSATVTVTATGMTATGTSISTGSGFDAAPPVGIADAFNADVAILPVPDAAALRDGAVADATGGLADAATAITPTSDAGLGMFDGGSVLADTGAGGKADALSTRQEGGQTATVDGARAGDAASAKTGASGGCGCALGGARTDRNTVWSLVGIALLVLWRRRSRPR
jgi:MYXO-CTERM domain-containing protein